MFRKKPQYVQNPYVAPPPPPEQGSAATLGSSIHNAEVRTGNLDSRITALEREIAGYKREMQRHRPGTSSHNSAKRRALQAMRQKKSLESRVSMSANAAFNLEQVRDAHAMQQDNKAMVQGLRVANQELRNAQHDIDIDEVEDLHDDMQEALEDVNDVSTALGRNYDVEGIDQSELEAELDELEQDSYATAAADTSQLDTPSYLTPSPVQPLQRPQQQDTTPAQSTHNFNAAPAYANPQGGRY